MSVGFFDIHFNLQFVIYFKHCGVKKIDATRITFINFFKKVIKFSFSTIPNFFFCTLTNVSRSDFVRFSWGSFLAFGDFISWFKAAMKVSTQLGNLSGNQLLLLLNLGSFELSSVDPKFARSLILQSSLRKFLLRFFCCIY